MSVACEVRCDTGLDSGSGYGEDILGFVGRRIWGSAGIELAAMRW